MKKIAIITLNNSINYGGILQAVALDKYFKKNGISPIFISHRAFPKIWQSPFAYKRRIALYGTKGSNTQVRIYVGMVKTLISNVKIFSRKKKILRFKTFQKNLNCTPYYETFEEVKVNCQGYDCYITGSDQVWNNEFTFDKQIDKCYTLSFVEGKSAKFSYAASVGGKKSDEVIKSLVSEIKDFSAISVREKSLCDGLQQTGLWQAVTVVDPVLLHSAEEWQLLENKIKLPERYIFVYSLDSDQRLNECIEKLAKDTGLPVVDVNPGFTKIRVKKHIKGKTYGPAEFLYVIDHATYVITNSFHALAFSYIFQKKFACILRHGQEDRMVDFLDMLNLTNHIIKNGDFDCVYEDIHYDKISLNTMVESSECFLKKIIDASIK